MERIRTYLAGRTPEERKAVKRAFFGVLIFLAFLLLAAAVVGKPLIQTVGDPETFRAWVRQHGVLGRFAFVGMMVTQIIIAFIPGEPLEIAAGYAFGAIEGTALCMLGAFIGGTIVFLAVRRFGLAFAELFFSEKRIREVAFLRDPARRNYLVFLLFFIPGTPKDLLTYCVGLTKMRLGSFMMITTFARFPSIITSTLGGDALGLSNYTFAAVVFAATILISLSGILVYRRVSRIKPAPAAECPPEARAEKRAEKTAKVPALTAVSQAVLEKKL